MRSHTQRLLATAANNSFPAHWRSRGPLPLVVVAFVLTCVVEQSALAQFIIYDYSWTNTNGNFVQFDPIPQGLHGPNNPHQFSYHNDTPIDQRVYNAAVAGPGGLGVATRIDLSGVVPQLPFDQTIQTDISAYSTFSDIVLSGPPDSDSVSGAFRLQLSGSMSASITKDPAYFYAAGTSATLSLLGTFPVQGDGNSSTFEGYLSVDDHSTVPHGSGVLSGGTGLITIPFEDAPAGVPLSLTMRLEALGGARVDTGDGTFSGGAFSLSATSSFFDTLTFDTQAFVLPDGYRADSAEAGIVNSMFVPAPEPSSIVMLGLGLIGSLAIVRRCKSQAAQPRKVTAGPL